jgi:hypothetical protein
VPIHRPVDPRPTRTPSVPWYSERTNRPPPAIQEPGPKSAAPAKWARPDPRLLVAAAGVVVLIAAAVLVGLITEVGTNGGAVLDVAKVQTGVVQTLSDPASGYGTNSVTDVSCNGGRNPSARKGTVFACDATVNGVPRHVTVLVSDDQGTYEIDGPR